MTAKRRPYRYFWILGLIALLGSAIGAGVALNPSRAGDTATRDSEAGPSGDYIIATGYGDVPDGVIALYPVQQGQVIRVNAKEESTFYQAGDVLMVVDTRPAQLLLDKARAGLKLAQEELAQAETLPRKLRDDLVKQQQAAVEAAEHELAMAQLDLDTKQEMVKTKLIKDKVARAAGEMVKRFQAKVKGERFKLQQLKDEDVEAKARLAREAVKAREIAVRQAELGLEQCELKAPMAGRVLRVQVRPGEVLGSHPQQAALLFYPDDKDVVRKHVIIRAELQQEYAGEVAVGKTAIVEDDTRAGERWTGKVTHLSGWYTHRRSIIPEPLNYNDVRTLECIVTLDPGKPRPRIGQRVRVIIGSNR